jgi:hypothetical protein
MDEASSMVHRAAIFRILHRPQHPTQAVVRTTVCNTPRGYAHALRRTQADRGKKYIFHRLSRPGAEKALFLRATTDNQHTTHPT